VRVSTREASGESCFRIFGYKFATNKFGYLQVFVALCDTHRGPAKDMIDNITWRPTVLHEIMANAALPMSFGKQVH
jgi:hypothetical protein